MAQGYLYMLAALLGFSMLGIFLKLADTRACRPGPLNAALYTASLAGVALVLALSGAGWAAPARVPALAIPFGVSASIAILAFQAGIRHGDIATSWLAINLSAAVPTIGSILIYHEPVGLKRALALCLIPVSLALIWKDKRDAEKRHG